MIALKQSAQDLHMKPEELQRQGIETFLRHKLKMIESEFVVEQLYKVKTLPFLIINSAFPLDYFPIKLYSSQ